MKVHNAFKIFVATLVAGLSFVFLASHASAATISVTNANDNTTSDSNCTLREAITNINDQANTYVDCTATGSAYGTSDTINFAITAGGTTFTEQSQTGYTITPTSALPNLQQAVFINGYSQPNALPNSNPAPNPLNTLILVEIDGSLAGSVNGFSFDGDNIEIRGLVVNNFEQDGIDVDGSNHIIAGNFLGTEPDGVTAAPNDNLGIGNGGTGGTGLLIGGLNPEDRNLVSGNGTVAQGGGISPNTGHNNWTFHGNYIGVDRTGFVALPNAQPGGSGSISLDNSDGHIVGGNQPGAINVISGNRSMGIAPHNVANLVVQGNYFGVGPDGVTPVPNGSTGINLSDCTNALIGGTADGEENIIHYNEGQGIAMTGSTSGVTIEGNSILNNEDVGIFVFNATDVTIGGSTTAQRNHIANNSLGISILGFGATASDVNIQGNYIGTDENGNVDSGYNQNYGGIYVLGSTSGVLIGGVGNGLANVIAGHKDFGIVTDSREVVAFGQTVTPQLVSILGNSIFANQESNTNPISSGLGIDHVATSDNESDGVIDSLTNDGPTLNDASDTDTGPNNYMNFPVINSAIQNGTALTVNFDLDAADSTNGTYRVEFFVNDTADPSGYGEGQTFLGATTVANGAAQEATLTLANGTDLTGKSITATTTAINNTTTSGFGATSEFSEAMAALVTAPATTPTNNLANTGTNVWLYGAGIVSLVGVGGYLGMRRLRILPY